MTFPISIEHRLSLWIFPSAMHHQPKTEFSTFRKALKDTILSLKEQNIVPVLMTLPPLNSDRYFSWITKKGVIAEKNILR